MKRRNKTLLTAGAAFAAVLMQSAAIGAQRPADARIPIIGWVGLPQDKASAERYAEAKDAGFTHLTQWCETPSDAGRLLAEAEKAGVKLIIGFGGRNIKRMTDEAEAFTAVAKGSPALEYYFIADEPHIEKAGDLRDCIARYEALDPAHPCYVNLLGAGWDPETRDDRRRTLRNTGCDTYGEYLESLFKAVPLKMLSFDVYPVCAAKPLGNAEHRLHGARAILNDRWYETLETASAFARKKGVPMFAFALSTAHGHFPGNEYTAPTIRHFRLQMYSNLAYGAQALQYFRYWAGGIAPVLVDGKRSPVFELVREMNQELQARAFVFRGAKVRKVWHTGVTIPIGTKRFDPKALPPFVTSFTADKRATLAVSWLKNGNTDYLVVLNRDPNDDTDFAATFAPGVKLVRRDGTLAEAGSYADFFWLEPGDVAVFAAPMLVPAPREMTVTGGGVPLAAGGEPLAGHPWIGDGLPDRNGADWYEEDPAPEFRATFALPEGTHDARLHFACAGFASLRAGDETLMAVDGLDMLWTPYDKTVYSKTFTVKPGAGPREIVVRLGNGFYNLPPLRFWGSKCFRTALAHGRPCFKLAMEIDGVEKPLEWKWRRTNVVRNSVYLGTEIDATRPEDAEWKPAAEVAGPRGTIRPWPEASMRSDGFHEGKAGWLKEGEVQVVDFGVNASGVPDFLFRGEARGTRIEIVYGERLNADGSVNVLTQTAGQVKRGNGGPGAPHVACQRDAYTCGGAVAERFSPPFTWHIFRYAEIRGAKRLLGAGDARRSVRSMVSLGEKAPAAKAFSTRNADLAAIHEMCRRTFQANMIGGVQSDCPGRERLGYGGDIVSTCEAMMLNWDMRAIYLKVLQDFADEASDDGWITETAPYTGIGDWGFDKRGGPVSWALAVPELIDGLLRHYNETRALDYYPVCARYIRLLAAKHPDGLVPKCIGDHEALQRAPDDMTATAHWHRFVSLTAGFAKRLGCADDAAEFGALADKIKAAFAAKYVKDGIVANGTQSAQAIALYLGLVPQNQVAAAERRLLESIEEKGYSPTTGIFSTRYMLMYLSEHGRRDAAEKIVLHKGFPGWLHMLDRGATTLWETWKESDNVFSNCHPMFGSVDEWILRFGK